ncbi:MAG: hybrid sensor histidine kinase/response regulator [Bdellovibrionales bacterium]|nr:hybrid sensor histidine kinase/response regulator [Bdellovibrionales bacterium]
MSDSSQQSKARVLIVDDCPNNRLLLSVILQKEGFVISECSDGLECLESVDRDAPDIVLLDIMMPHLDGISTLSKLREKFTKDALPVIMITAKNTSEDLAEAFSVGASDFISKPVDRLKLLARLENQIELLGTKKQVELEKHKLQEALSARQHMGDLLPEAVAVLSSGGQIIYMNLEAINRCGNPSPVTESELLCSIWGGKLKDAHDQMKSILSTGDDIPINHEVKTAGNIPEYIQIISRQLVTPDGNLSRLWVWRDLTVQRSLESQTRQQVAMDTVGLFATGVAHNFNNLLGGINGAAEMLRRTLAGNRMAERCLDIIRQSVTQGAALTKKMVVISHERKGNGMASSIPVKYVVDDVISVQSVLLEKEVSLINEIGSNIVFKGIPYNHLVDVFSNVIGNALDALEAGGSVRMYSAQNSRNECILVVEDTGCGIPEDQIDRIFDPFFSTKSIDVENGISMVGNGLGLWNVRNLMKMSGGDIRIETELGRGTKVSLTFPSSVLSSESQREKLSNQLYQ